MGLQRTRFEYGESSCVSEAASKFFVAHKHHKHTEILQKLLFHITILKPQLKNLKSFSLKPQPSVLYNSQ